MDHNIKKKITKSQLKYILREQDQKFIYIEVKGDGNCLFRAIAQIIYGIQDKYKEIRQFAVLSLKNNQQLFEPQIHASLIQSKLKYLQNKEQVIELNQGSYFQQYLQIIEKDMIHGGQLEILALALYLNKRINVKGILKNQFQIFNENGQENIYIEFIKQGQNQFQGHYRALKKIN